MLPGAVQVADPVHLMRLAGEKLELGPPPRAERDPRTLRGRKDDPLYWARKLLVLNQGAPR